MKCAPPLRWTHDFNLGEAIIHIKHKICNLRTKCDINFTLGLANLYNLKILVVNTTINLEAF